MATTTNYGWSTPDDTGLVKDGALNIRTLGSAIDTTLDKSYLAWQTWAPVLSGGWANGNGVWTAKYCQIGKTVIAVGYFVVGSTTTRGTGLNISLPVTASNVNNINGTSWCGTTATTGFSVVHLAPNTTSQIALFAQNTAGTFINSATITTTTPITWATGSVISFTVVYEAA